MHPLVSLCLWLHFCNILFKLRILLPQLLGLFELFLQQLSFDLVLLHLHSYEVTLVRVGYLLKL